MEQTQTSKRIEYIDALRGFTMMLVIMTHVATWGLASDSYNHIFTVFRMPLFFFVSGFVFYKTNYVWNWSNSLKFLHKKLSVQIISPFLFFAAYVFVQNINFIDGLIAESKVGYWFTLTLFEFFVIYLLFQQVFRLLHVKDKWQDIILLGIGLIFYGVMRHKIIGHSTIVSALGCIHWNKFIFFILGTRIRKYFEQFERLLDKTQIVLICILVFFGLSLYPALSYIHEYIQSFVLAITGIIVVFAGFRHYQETFSHSRRIGRIFQFIGRRTLDIYLIHYFFVFSGIASFFEDLNLQDAPFVSFIICVLVSMCVIAACLLVSQILRISPFLARFLFGQKPQEK
ncbi:MAG: acyltransferase [Prevotellaceae bacterium]|nr:acyltransferase [Candidatus Faecinaster equi]